MKTYKTLSVLVSVIMSLGLMIGACGEDDNDKGSSGLVNQAAAQKVLDQLDDPEGVVDEDLIVDVLESFQNTPPAILFVDDCDPYEAILCPDGGDIECDVSTSSVTMTFVDCNLAGRISNGVWEWNIPDSQDNPKFLTFHYVDYMTDDGEEECTNNGWLSWLFWDSLDIKDFVYAYSMSIVRNGEPSDYTGGYGVKEGELYFFYIDANGDIIDYDLYSNDDLEEGEVTLYGTRDGEPCAVTLAFENTETEGTCEWSVAYPGCGLTDETGTFACES